jgi:MFS family permease
MQDPDASRIGLVTSMPYAGSIVGAFFGGFFSDRCGRKAVIVAGVLCCITGFIIQGASRTVGMFIASRALIRAGDVQTVIGPSLVAELAHHRIRGTILAFVSRGSISDFII